jgi:Protein of unknown function, DUF547
MKVRVLVLMFVLAASARATATVVALEPCARLYADVVFDGAVDYAKVAAHPDRAACQRAIAEATPPDDKTPESAAVAFWADAYNLLSMLAIAEDPSRYSARQDGKILFRDRIFTVAHQRMTLDQLEHDRLGARTKDPRVEFLLSCGSRSCALLPGKLLSTSNNDQSRLDAAIVDGMRRWFAREDNLRVVRASDGTVSVEIGQLLQQDWHGQDFERGGHSLMELIASALDARAQSSDPVAAIAAKEAAAGLRSGRLKPTIRAYDWRVNRVRKVFALP